MWSQEQLRRLLTACGSTVVDHGILAVGHADQLLDHRGELADAETEKHITELVIRLVAAVAPSDTHSS